MAVRDAVNRRSRKPFYWGGLKGYQQLAAIAVGLHQSVGSQTQNPYIQQLLSQVDRTLESTAPLAASLQNAHTWLLNIAACLRYPPSSYPQHDLQTLNSQRIEKEMTALLEQFRKQTPNNRVLTALYDAVNARWHVYGKDLLPCYDIPGLPPDNLHLESLFNQLRRHQRRISGQQSTKPLRDFGQFQVLFLADSQTDLLEQMRRVPLAEYHKHRRRLAQAEAPRIFLHRLHRNPKQAVQLLLTRYIDRQAEISSNFQFPVQPAPV
jgi:translation initiation factor 2B subunit (eIF-2B alpha/beta/delta family)